jgi:hypothetical protein
MGAERVEKPPGDLEIPGYHVIRLIASGGMGSVYEAERLTTGGRFAVKVIRPQLLTGSSYIRRFEREVKALRSIRHPHVVDIFEWHLPDSAGGGLPYVVMELLIGESLEHLLRRMERMRAAQAVSVMLQVLDGLAAAHELGVIHRDLGPSNIFLCVEAGDRLCVKLLDFGLVRPVDDAATGPAVTQEGTLMGKPGYVAPEMFRGEHLDARSDLFACGMLMYRMLAGELPYRERQADLLWVERYGDRASAREYPGPRSVQPDVPEVLDAIVARAIRTRPEDRFASARVMQSMLLPLRVASARAEEEITTTIRSGAALAGEAVRSGGIEKPGRGLAAAGREEQLRPLQPSDRAARAARELHTQEAGATTAFGVRATRSEPASPRGRREVRLAAFAVMAAAAAIVVMLGYRRLSGPAPGEEASRAAPVGSAAVAGAGLPAEPSIPASPPSDPAPVESAAGEVRAGVDASATESSSEPTAVGPQAGTATAVPARGDAGYPERLPRNPWAATRPGPASGIVPEGAALLPPELPPAPTVHLRFVGVPEGAEVRVDGRPVPPDGADVPRSVEPVRVTVTATGDDYAPFAQGVVPTMDREVRVRLEPRAAGSAAAAARDAGSAPDGMVQGRFGTVFVTEFGDP